MGSHARLHHRDGRPGAPAAVDLGEDGAFGCFISPWTQIKVFVLSAIRAFEPIEVQEGFPWFLPFSPFRTPTLFLIVFFVALRPIIGIPTGRLRPRSVLRFLHGHGKGVVVDQQRDFGPVTRAVRYPAPH